jgi:Spherulation-specific family 4
MKYPIYSVLAAASTLSLASVEPMGILVPAYFYPTSELGNFWGKLNVAAPQVPLTAILNPNSGPGSAPDTNYQAAVTALTNAGGHVIGYVHTRVSEGSLILRDLSEVEAEIDHHIAWYGSHGLDGIFLDEMRSDPDSSAGMAYPGMSVRQYYQALYLYITSNRPGYRVIGNPGVSGGGIEQYLQSPPAVDTLVTFEDKAGYGSAVPPAWVENYTASHFANIPYHITSAASMDQDVRLARSRNVGYIYVTDDLDSGPYVNPWDTLPSYWDQEVQLVQRINAAALPTRLFLSIAPNQVASLFVSGNPGTYRVQASNDLVNWVLVTTTVTACGGFTWTDPASTSSTRRFYRTVP